MKQQPFGKGIPILTWRKPGEFFAGIPHFVENIDICAESGALKTAPDLYGRGRTTMDGAEEAERYCGRKRGKQSADQDIERADT